MVKSEDLSGSKIVNTTETWNQYRLLIGVILNTWELTSENIWQILS